MQRSKAPSSTVNALVAERLNIPMVGLTTLTGTGRKATSLSQVEVDQVAEYACQQAEMLLRIRPELEAQLHERGQWPLFEEMELPLVPVLFRMEHEGIAIDIAVLRDMARQMSGEIE